MLGWSINLFRIRGIRISLHATFPLILAYAAYKGWQIDGTTGALWQCGSVLTFFACVVLHELGHSFTAMKFGVKVRQILLTPIGGMAQFDQIPRKPSQELLMTIAGPAVNFVIAGLLWCVLDFPEGWNDILVPESLADLGRTLFIWNIGVGLFNLIPAFPMDGGRILRAFLAMKMSYVRATYWAATVGKVITIAAFVYELMQGRNANFFYIAICYFIFNAGEAAEYRMVRCSARRRRRAGPRPCARGSPLRRPRNRRSWAVEGAGRGGGR